MSRFPPSPVREGRRFPGRPGAGSCPQGAHHDRQGMAFTGHAFALPRKRIAMALTGQADPSPG